MHSLELPSLGTEISLTILLLLFVWVVVGHLTR
jgi:hypothetical protein